MSFNHVALPSILTTLLWVGAGTLICGLCFLYACLIPLWGKADVKLQVAKAAASASSTSWPPPPPPLTRYDLVDCINLREHEGDGRRVPAAVTA